MTNKDEGAHDTIKGILDKLGIDIDKEIKELDLTVTMPMADWTLIHNLLCAVIQTVSEDEPDADELDDIKKLNARYDIAVEKALRSTVKERSEAMLRSVMSSIRSKYDSPPGS